MNEFKRQFENLMVAFLRRFLVMVLVALQFAAPLVHAHVNDIGLAHGLHIHEFEALHLKSDTFLVAAFEYADTAQSAIVGLGEAIKIRQPSHDVPPVYFRLADLSLPVQYVVETIGFSPHQPFSIAEPFFNQHSSRAPPSPI
ncbi:MAG: hypothetical protein PHH11_00330 [Methylomonas sp.]|nr:hypothetical protein [Methylomonas sp.]